MTPDRPPLRSDVAFSPAVKEAQRQHGSYEGYARRLAQRDWQAALPAELQDYLAARDSIYVATASAGGQPYMQHRGGAPGFVTVLDPVTIAFADYAGNRQYVSVGNLSENPRVMIFAMDYPNRRRLKLWGHVEVVAWGAGAPPPRVRAVLAASAGQRVERVFVVTLDAWDLNCPQNITPRYTADELPPQPALRFVALQVSDRDGYARYRAEMAPHLARHGGRFVLDVEGGAAHIHPVAFVPDRVLLIAFPSRARADAFAADPAYVAVRRQHFDPAVARVEVVWLS